VLLFIVGPGQKVLLSDANFSYILNKNKFVLVGLLYMSVGR